MAIKFDHVQLFMGPANVAPAANLDDLEKVITDFIDGAEKSLDIAVQEIDSLPIVQAIVRATRRTWTTTTGKTRKLRVRIVTEADYLSLREAPDDVFLNAEDTLEGERNRRLHVALLRSSAWVRTDFNPHIFHQKFIIRDGTTVLTGSTNFTPTGTHNNLNHILVVDNAKVAKQFSDEFGEIAKGHFGKFNIAPPRKPEPVIVDDIRVKVCFAPDHGPEMEISKQMAKAKDRVEFAIFTFAESSAIDDQMLLLMEAGRTIRGAMDHAQGRQKWAATVPLKKRGAELYFVKGRQNAEGTSKVGKLHHKLMVIDRTVTIIGSFNYTGPANLLNDENIVVLGDDDNPTDNQKKLARYAATEIERIIAAHGREITIKINAAGVEQAV